MWEKTLVTPDSRCVWDLVSSGFGPHTRDEPRIRKRTAGLLEAARPRIPQAGIRKKIVPADRAPYECATNRRVGAKCPWPAVGLGTICLSLPRPPKPTNSWMA